MKGFAVAIIFVIINVIAATIFLIVTTTSISSSILEEEKLSKEALERILEVYSNKNIASREYYNAIIKIPRLDVYTVNALGNYISRVERIENDISLIDKPLTFQEYQYLQARIQENINKINYVARNYPTLRNNVGYMNTSRNLTPIIEDERNSIKTYNNHIIEYNKLTSNFPSNIVAGIMGKFPYLTFETGTNIISQTERLFN